MEKKTLVKIDKLFFSDKISHNLCLWLIK